MKFGELEFAKKGASHFDFRDLYYLALTLRWPHFFLALLGVDLAINLIFALLYLAEPDVVTLDEQRRPHADLTRLSLVERDGQLAAPALEAATGTSEAE